MLDVRALVKSGNCNFTADIVMCDCNKINKLNYVSTCLVIEER